MVDIKVFIALFFVLSYTSKTFSKKEKVRKQRK